jgi:predicted RecB family nuclease
LHGNQIGLSAHDLINHVSCQHLTALDFAAAEGRLKPPFWRDPGLEALQLRGLEHEKAYLDHLREQGVAITEISGSGSEEGALARTRAAMASGVEAISQAVLGNGRWRGRADVLRRVSRTSGLGDWSYEAIETKLAREARPGAILQLCVYSELIAEIQGVTPERAHIVPPGSGLEPDTFRLLDFLAYFRHVKRSLESKVDDLGSGEEEETYPDPAAHCDICRWWPSCDRRRRDDDHLSLVAGISKLQTRELQERDVHTLTRLAKLNLPFEDRPRRGSPEGYVRVREQSRVQFESRGLETPVYEMLDVEDGLGLCQLPQPSRGDIFFDIEGDPFVGEVGLEYLFGYVLLEDGGAESRNVRWALNPTDEKSMFEAFVDDVMARWSLFPDLHIYHYSAYEPSALKRLMGRYASREREVDRMLRAGIFVDLYSIVRQSIRAGIERYGLKDLEVFYSFVRDAELRDASRALHAVELELETGDGTELPEEIRGVVERYNLDDCLSTMHLRDWLEQLRAVLEREGHRLPRPESDGGDPGEELDERQRAIRGVMESLLHDVPVDAEHRSEEQQARWILAHMLEWHWRELKPVWWEYFRLLELPDEELLYEYGAIYGLMQSGRIGQMGRRPIDRYGYPRQDTDIRRGDEVLMLDGEPFGKIIEVDLVERTIDIVKRVASAERHPVGIFAHTVIRTTVLSQSLFDLAKIAVESNLDSGRPSSAAFNLLLRRPPAALALDPELTSEESELVLEKARNLVLRLAGDVLPIQGPPGSGKTYAGARMICELVRAGKRVGITAVSHKVIRNLLEEVLVAAKAEGTSIRCVQKVSADGGDEESEIREVKENDQVYSALVNEEADVAAGTAWLWARPEYADAVDVLFVDEAGQMSLANVLAIARAASGIVLLGDPQQLQQPQQGSHPPGTEVSALQHLLGEEKTIPSDRGLFLAETWRLHPSICRFTSELFYEERLSPRADLEKQSLTGPTPFAGAGLWYVPVEDEGNRNSSRKEAEAIKGIVKQLLRDSTGWTDREGANHPLALEDILIIAPYNAQVAEIGEQVPGARVGTVDRFQGQEAPVVIYSLASSSPEEAPRGMEFLYSLNRLNVAVSRARCVCVLVGSPLLFEPECRSPRQMRLANSFCRYLELAQKISPAPVN